MVIGKCPRSIVFLYFFALIAEEVCLIFPCYSLELCIQMGISFLFSFAFHFFSQLQQTVENSLARPQKVNIRLPYDPAIPFLTFIQKK